MENYRIGTRTHRSAKQPERNIETNIFDQSSITRLCGASEGAPSATIAPNLRVVTCSGNSKELYEIYTGESVYVAGRNDVITGSFCVQLAVCIYIIYNGNNEKVLLKGE